MTVGGKGAVVATQRSGVSAESREVDSAGGHGDRLVAIERLIGELVVT